MSPNYDDRWVIIDLSQAGFTVIPLAPKKKVPWSGLRKMLGAEKGTVLKAAVERPLTSEQIEALLKKPLLNWGLLLDGSGIGVLDVDDPDGMAQYLGRELPPGPRVETRRGFQTWYRATGLKSRQVIPAADEGGLKQGELGEFKTKGLVLLPPSVHPQGKVYRWVTPLEADWPDVPDWLAERARLRTERGEGSSVLKHGTDSVLKHGTPLRPPSLLGGATPSSPVLLRKGARGKGETEPSPGGTQSAYVQGESPGLIDDRTALDILNSDLFAARMMELWGADWPGMGRKFQCLIPAPHATGDQAMASANIYRNRQGHLRYRCFLGHSGRNEWSLVPVFAYVVTQDVQTLGRPRLSDAEILVWSARAIIDLGFGPAGSLADNLLPLPLVGVSPATAKVYAGFIKLLDCRLLFDASAVYTAIYSQEFAARWVGVSRRDVADALAELVRMDYLHRVTKHARAQVYSVGKMPRRSRTDIDWWRNLPEPSWTLPGILTDCE